MHILVDYRPALRERTGVGEYVHELARALVATPEPGETLWLFSASWKDRLAATAVPGARTVDRRVPVRWLNYAWHHWSWPAVESLTGLVPDVVQSLHPLLLPARKAAQVVTVHDLDFLDHAERTRAEIRRDYPRLAEAHARRADRVIVVSRSTADEVVRRLGVSPDCISICSPGAPAWPRREREPAADDCILFVGTLEPRKNVGVLLDAYARVRAARPDAPPLVIAGRITPEAAPWVARAREAPLAGHVEFTGYLPHEALPALYARALLLVLPSHLEGFGLPALEAMTVGVPVVAADRGALPEVVGRAGLLVDSADPADVAAAIVRLLAGPEEREQRRIAGWDRAAAFTWTATAAATRDAWALAHEARRRRG